MKYQIQIDYNNEHHESIREFENIKKLLDYLEMEIDLKDDIKKISVIKL